MSTVEVELSGLVSGSSFSHEGAMDLLDVLEAAGIVSDVKPNPDHGAITFRIRIEDERKCAEFLALGMRGVKRTKVEA
jgi:hypothetical protein